MNQLRSMRLVLWDEDTKRIQSGNTYKFCKAIVKSYKNQKYITLNKQISIQSSTTQVHREDAITNSNSQNTVTCPVERLTTYLSCTKCNSSLIAFEWWWQDNLVFQLWHGKTQNKVQKQSSCYKVLFVTADQEEVTLTIFDDKFSVLYAIYKQQSGHVKWRLGFVRVPVNFFSKILKLTPKCVS